MANYATNIFSAISENQHDLDKLADFLDDNFTDTLIGMAIL